MNLPEIVAQMRALGVTHYEHQDSTHSFKVTLGPEPHRSSDESGQVPGGSASEAAAGEAPSEDSAVPEQYRRLPLAYQNPMLYGSSKLPPLGK